MSEQYFILKRKLEDLGYNAILPIDAVPIVECVLADLLQTTRSLQHYMDLSKEALMQRDSLMMEAEPYKCDNARLIKENNNVHKELMQLREEYLKLTKESKRKIRSMSDELIRKDQSISKLQHEIRDISLRGLCADTLSSRVKSRKKEVVGGMARNCMCSDKRLSSNDKNITELTNKIQILEEKNEAYCDEIVVLKNQVEHRDNEIIRLNILLEGGRPLTAISKDCCNIGSNDKVLKLMTELRELEAANDAMKKDMESGLDKQHEAMLRALDLAEKNKSLQAELKNVDTLALRVEEDCNKRLAIMKNEVNQLQTRLEGLVMKNSELEQQIMGHSKHSTPKVYELQESLTAAGKENEALNKEIKDLVELNKCLQDKIVNQSQMSKRLESCDESSIRSRYKCTTKSELQLLLEEERKRHESHMTSLQKQMTEIMSSFNDHMSKCSGAKSPKSKSLHKDAFVRDLHTTLCESEQKILMLRKENDELKMRSISLQENSKQNYKDVISQLNVENSELSKENIALSEQLSQYKNLNTLRNHDRGDYSRTEIHKLKDKIKELSNEIQVLKKDKQEYNFRYKETFELSEKLKRDLIFKQKEIDQLEEENRSYKMTNRNGRASTEHLREECQFLKEQLKKIQSDVIKEKTLSSQIKNIQIETERSSNELQNELLSLQRKLSLSTDNTDSLERKCKDLQGEIASLRAEKSNLIDSIKKVDQERDKLVIDLDNKTENVSILEQKLKSQQYDIAKLENEIIDLKRKLTVNKVSEHKMVDYETQTQYLNGEILRLNKQLDSCVMENKHLQNSLADANGTLKLTKIEYDKSRQEVDTLKQQLQHYVAEIRRIEEMLSHKEAERSDMLEHFASLSVEANILENTNHSLESESASKSVQLQTYISQIQTLEEKLIDKEATIDSQASRISTMTCKITSLENEIRLITEEKTILEQNVSYLKQMCSNLQSEHSNITKGLGDTETDLKLYENRIKSLSRSKSNLEDEKNEMKQNLATTEKLLSNARKEIVELKLALQDATSETKSLQENVSRLSRREIEIHESTTTREEFELPLILDEIQEASQEEDFDSGRYHSVHRRVSKFTHSGTI